MRKIANQSNQYNLINNNSKSIKNQQSLTATTNQSKNAKNKYFTGNNLYKKQSSSHKIYAKLKQQTPQGSQTDVTRKYQQLSEQSKTSKQQSKIQNQFKTVAELQNQIQRIMIQLQTKNNQIKLINKINQKRKTQIIQLEKKVQFCEGKNHAIEAQLKLYQGSMLKIGKQCDERAKYKSQVEQLVSLFEGIRTQNQRLNGKYQQKCYQLSKLTQKYIKLKSKTSIIKNNENKRQNKPKRQLSLRRGNSLLSISRRMYESSENQKQAQSGIKQLNIKLQIIERNINKFVKQNQKLVAELQEKDELIYKLQTQILQLKEKYNKQILNKNNSTQEKINQIQIQKQRIRLNNQIIIYKEINQSLSTTTQQCEKQNKKQKDKDKDKDYQISLILRKLKFNLLAEQTSYEDLLHTLVNPETKAQDLVKFPFCLNFFEADQILKWIVKNYPHQKNIEKQTQKINQSYFPLSDFRNLGEKIPKFKNIIIRKLYFIKINVRNCFLNRENQLDEQILIQNILNFSQAELYFRNWGFTQQEIDVLFKNYFQTTGELEKIDLRAIKETVSKWNLG